MPYGLQRNSRNLKINKMEQELVFYYSRGGVEYITPSYHLAFTRTDDSVRMAVADATFTLEELEELLEA